MAINVGQQRRGGFHSSPGTITVDERAAAQGHTSGEYWECSLTLLAGDVAPRLADLDPDRDCAGAATA